MMTCPQTSWLKVKPLFGLAVDDAKQAALPRVEVALLAQADVVADLVEGQHLRFQGDRRVLASQGSFNPL